MRTGTDVSIVRWRLCAAGATHSREYLVNIGLKSTLGAAAPTTPYRDKVALYTGIEAHTGTGDVWSINPLVTQMPGSGAWLAAR